MALTFLTFEFTKSNCRNFVNDKWLPIRP